MSLFDQMLQNKKYKQLLEQLPKDEREMVKKSLRNFVEQFEEKVIDPIKQQGRK